MVGRVKRIVRRARENLFSFFLTVRFLPPQVETESEIGDCGYSCMAAAAVLFSRPSRIDDIKNLVGTTSRGLTLHQVRDGLRLLGFDAEAVFFDIRRASVLKCPAILLLTQGHYVLVARIVRGRAQIFDPSAGWSWVKARRLLARSQGLAIELAGKPSEAPVARVTRATPNRMRRVSLRQFMRVPMVMRAVAMFALAQLMILLVPLLSMYSVDSALTHYDLDYLSIMAFGFIGMMFVGQAMDLLATLTYVSVRRLMFLASSREMFDALVAKPAQWFYRNTGSSIQNKVASLRAVMDFYLEGCRSAGSISVSLTIGIIVAVVISPLVVLPSLISQFCIIAIDLVFDRVRRDNSATTIELNQRRQAFVIDVFTQMPLIRRLGVHSRVRARYLTLSRNSAFVDGKTQVLQGWRVAIVRLVSSAETLGFVTIAALFVDAGKFTVGGLVALGAYKTLFADGVAAAVNFHLQRRAMLKHLSQAESLFENSIDSPPSINRPVHGAIKIKALSFNYGSLDPRSLLEINLSIQPGELVIIRGESGAGKSTLAKIIVGILEPTRGSVTIDGHAPSVVTTQVSSVLQEDRLMEASIRDNILFFRSGVSDDQIWSALDDACLGDFVRSLPMGLNTRVANNLGGLSGGQLQRILIARAIVSNPHVLVLDEATSNLDTDAETAILLSVKARGITTILITHRPTNWGLGDRIFVFEANGRLSELQGANNSDLDSEVVNFAG